MTNGMVTSSPFEERDGAGDEGAGVGARGGPLMMPALETGLICVRGFQRSCVTLLSVVESELEEIMSLATCDNDLKVDDLKTVTDAELVDRALIEVLQGKAMLGESMEAEEGNNSCHQGESNDQSNRLEVLHADFGRKHESAGALAESGSGRDDSEGVGNHLPSSPAVTEVPETGTASAGNSNKEAQEPEAQMRKGRSRKRKGKDDKEEMRRRGRPYDRAVRSAHLTTNGDDQREEALTRLKLARDSAKENCGLNSLRVKKERDSMSNICAKLPSKFFTTALKTQDQEITGEHHVSVGAYEVVLHVEIYDGMRRHMKTQEFMVLGSQFLTALRDKIYCLTDNLAEKAGIHMPSGFFLIEDVFYDDLRDPRAIEYSGPFIQWIEEQKQASLRPRKRGEKKIADENVPMVRRRHRRCASSLPTLSSASMAVTSFLDLSIKIGAPYLYCHQGDCKHTMIFRDLRMVHPDDVQNAAVYPVLKFIPKLRFRKCTICDIYRAKKVTFDDALAPSSPCFLCENCYHLLHYSDENKLLHEDFKVYDYSHE